MKEKMAKPLAISKKQMFCTVLAVIIAAGAFGTGGFFIGRSNAQSEYQAESELNVKLNLSELDGLGEINGTIYVTGHNRIPIQSEARLHMPGCCGCWVTILRQWWQIMSTGKRHIS